MVDPKCPFCRIVTGQEPADIVYHDDLVTAFQDIHPMAPVHLLIVPNHHLESVNAVADEDERSLARRFATAAMRPNDRGVDGSGYRLVINTGRDAFQSVLHLHMHLIGGKPLPFRMLGHVF
ncbi:MAG TPA: purine nucleoside phosphoramidase [Anaerolineaceae bacterium]|nr:MAG: hypothetical protein A2X24_13070 [Chloroflexi bacterium GWB2_54_36]HAL16722.1 purine nucleoside phosphoramidase [Anaerolineaceae bacterium]HBA90328.1 purine nucleoside phosphoramidase [Anaerolineaceae bacterium]